MRWSLSRKVQLIALANLLLYGLAMVLFMLSQFRFGPESLLLGPARDRILAIGNAFSLEFEATPGGPYDALFASYRQRYHADFYLVDPDGAVLAGPVVQAPDAVVRRLKRPPPPGAPPRRPPFDRKGPPPDRRGKFEFRKGPPPPRPGGGRNPGPEPVFLVITSSPVAYWAGTRIPASRPDVDPGRPAILLIRSDSIFNDKLFFDVRIGLGFAAALIAISMLCWLPFTRGLTHAIAEMDRATGQIAEGRFEAQVVTKRSDELGHLGLQINRLASRLDGFVGNQKRFLGDIAHELCAPIARIQFALGILEQKAEEGQRHHVAVLYEEVQEMSALVNELLLFSKAGLNPATVPLTPVDVASVVHRAVSREAAADAAIDIQVPDGLTVRAYELFVVRAIANVVRNAVRYAGAAGPITIAAERTNSDVEIRIADCGPGLPESELEQVFAPFYRPEQARTRETGGTGLGLAIVKTCIEACGGSVRCRNRKPSGLEVTMRLPAA